MRSSYIISLPALMACAATTPPTPASTSRPQAARTAEPEPTPAEADRMVLAAASEIAAPPVLYFEYDSSTLSRQARQDLDTLAERMLAGDAVAILGGHADERGTPEYNLALGNDRAEAVRRYLVWRGVERARLRAVSYGEERPADPGHGEASWARNRRVEVDLAQPKVAERGSP